jgi:hypothetical protein
MSEPDQSPRDLMRAAEAGPIAIPEDGRPAYVLMTYEHFVDLAIARARRLARGRQYQAGAK